MSKTYEPIATQTLSADAASVIFTNIPTNYTDLVLVAYASSTWTSATELRMRFNSNAETYYSTIRLYGTGSSAFGGRESSGSSYGYLGYLNNSSTSYTFIKADIFNYRSTNMSKAVLIESGEASSRVQRQASLWNLQLAIDSILLISGSGNLRAGSTFSLYGVSSADLVQGSGVQATGGDEVYISGGYKYHKFLSSGSLNVSSGGNIEYLVVSGGGGGGAYASSNVGAGGGGAGGVLTGSTTVSAINYSITIGAGGSASSSGNASSALSISSVGGGAGNSNSGGSGGGAGGGTSSANFIGGLGTSGQGNNGGDMVNETQTSGGGGGGAGSAGSQGRLSLPGSGGASTTIWNIKCAAGGGGAGFSYSDAPGGTAGASGSSGVVSRDGIGGRGGAASPTNVSPTSGSGNTGSGGGGAMTAYSQTPGNGGSGIVVVRYAI